MMRLLDDVVRPQEQRRRNRQAERLGSLEVDDQLESCELLDRETAWMRTLQHLVDVAGRIDSDGREIAAIGKQRAFFRAVPLVPGHRKPLRERRCHDERCKAQIKIWRDDEYSIGVSGSKRREHPTNVRLIGRVSLHPLQAEGRRRLPNLRELSWRHGILRIDEKKDSTEPGKELGKNLELLGWVIR